MVQFRGGRTLHLIILPNMQRAVCTYGLFRVTNRKLAVLTGVGVQAENIHIMDFLLLLESVVGSRDLVSNPVQVIWNIYWKILYMGVRR